LHGLQHVHPDLDQVAHQRRHVPAAVEGNVNIRPKGPDVVHDSLVAGPVPAAVVPRAHDQGTLGTQVVADPHDVHARPRIAAVNGKLPFRDAVQDRL